MQKNIMIVDDDPSICKLLESALKKNGYRIVICNSGEEATKELSIQNIDAIILDIVLPGIDGIEVLKRIRNNPLYSKKAVIMLTNKDSEVETVLGLEMGADDYLSKPVRYHELLVRLKKVLERKEEISQKSEKNISIHGIDINRNKREVQIKGTVASLRNMEYRLLLLLTSNPGKVFSRKILLDILWEDEQFIQTRTVDVHIRRLREKLEEHGIDPDIIETIRSVGYRLSEEII